MQSALATSGCKGPWEPLLGHGLQLHTHMAADLWQWLHHEPEDLSSCTLIQEHQLK